MTFISHSDFLIEVAKGNVAGHSLVHKFGKNPSVPNGAWAFLTPLGQTNHVLSAPTPVRIKAGGDAADDSAGNGAREIVVQGIVSGTFLEETETITTNGTSASTATTKSFARVHRAYVSAVGTYGGTNTGDITIENGAGGTDILTMLAGEGQSQEAIWTVPSGKTAHLLSIDITVDASKAADIRVWTRESFADVTAPMPAKRIRKFFDGVTGPVSYWPRSPDFSAPALTDIWVEALGGGAQTEVSADFELLVVDD